MRNTESSNIMFNTSSKGKKITELFFEGITYGISITKQSKKRFQWKTTL